MLGDITESAIEPHKADKVAILADQLLATFGADACDVVEQQIEAADDEEARSTWNAIWDRLCGSKARPE